MKTVKIDAKHSPAFSSFEDFSNQVKQSCPQVETVFRDKDGYVAKGKDDTGAEKEVRITPTITSHHDYQAFFHGNEGSFQGEVNVPEPADFGMENPPEPEKTEEPVPEAESQLPADKAVVEAEPKAVKGKSILKS